MTDHEEEIVRKAIFVPRRLWQMVRIEAAQRDVELGDVINEMLSDRYGWTGNARRAPDAGTARNGDMDEYTNGDGTKNRAPDVAVLA